MMAGGPALKVNPRALAVARAFGDSDMKTAGEKGQPLVVSTPDITGTNVTAEDAFVVIACDGVWDVLSDQEVCGMGFGW